MLHVLGGKTLLLIHCVSIYSINGVNCVHAFWFSVSKVSGMCFCGRNGRARIFRMYLWTLSRFI